MRKFLGTSFLVIGLAACAGPPPNDGPEYFDNITPDPASLERKSEEDRLAAAEGKRVNVRPPTETTPLATATPSQTSGTTVTVDLSGNTKKPAKPVPEGDGSISNSQDFNIVKANESIESDAAKLQNLKENYEIVQPGAAPTRNSGDINLAKYALSQTNPVGNKIHTRFALSGRKAQKNCAVFNSADDAQASFLKNGGPQKDRRGLDPDGDGYACGWSPAVYRSLIGQ